jgi:transposase
MRGQNTKQSSMLCLMSPESRVPAKHPLRRVKALAEAVLQQLCPLFDEMYSAEGRPSIPPERLLKATLLMALYTVRSERLFCEQLDYNMLFRWFLDMDMTEESFDASTFSKNRERLIKHDVAGEFFRAVVEQARAAKLLSTDHFTVDGTLIEAWASLKSFRRKDGSDKQGPPDDPGNPTVNFHGEKRGNETHESTTDPESRLARKGYGKEAKLCYAGHALMENRNGLLVDLRISEANGRAECETAIDMLADVATGGRITVAGDKGYDTAGFVDACRRMNITPQIAQNTARRGGSAIDGRTTRHRGYSLSQKIRKRVEEIFGWAKGTGGLRRTRFKGKDRTQLGAYLVGAAYNLMRIARLAEVPA